MEGRYSKVYSRFWTSKKVRGWNDDTKYLSLYLLTNPHANIIGCYVLPKQYICGDLEWKPEQLGKPFAKLLAEDFISFDEESNLILVRKKLKHDPIANKNQAISAGKIILDLPKSPLLLDLKQIVEGLDKPYLKPLLERLEERLPEPVTVTVSRNRKEKEEENPRALELEDLAQEIKGWKPSDGDFDFFVRLLGDASFTKIRKTIEDLRVYQQNPKTHYKNLQSTLRHWSIKEEKGRENDKPSDGNGEQQPRNVGYKSPNLGN